MTNDLFIWAGVGGLWSAEEQARLQSAKRICFAAQGPVSDLQLAKYIYAENLLPGRTEAAIRRGISRHPSSIEPQPAATAAMAPLPSSAKPQSVLSSARELLQEVPSVQSSSAPKSLLGTDTVLQYNPAAASTFDVFCQQREGVHISVDDLAQLQQIDGRVNGTIITTYLAHRVLSAMRQDFNISFVSPAFFQEIQRNNGVAVFSKRPWTHGFDFFSQHFVCFAVGGNDHWSLAVLCHPRAARLSRSPLFPCILIFDSHIDSGLHDHRQIAAHLRAYLQLLSSASSNAFTDDNMPLISLPVPQQKWGSVDCGVFMLHNLDQFIVASSELLSLASTYVSQHTDLKPQTLLRIQEVLALPNVLVKRTSIVAVLQAAASVPLRTPLSLLSLLRPPTLRQSRPTSRHQLWQLLHSVCLRRRKLCHIAALENRRSGASPRGRG